MSLTLSRVTILQIIHHLQQLKEQLSSIQQIDLRKILCTIKEEAICLNLKLHDELLESKDYAFGKLEEIIKIYQDILKFDDKQLKKWQQNKNQDFQNGELLDLSSISAMLSESFSEKDSQWEQYLQPIQNNEKTKYQTVCHPQQEIVNKDIYRISIRLNHLFKNIFGFPIIILNPSIKGGKIIIFATITETIESLWCKILKLKILDNFFIFYFYNQYENQRRMFRNSPLITFENHKLNLAINLITSQQAYIPMVEYKLQNDSKKDEKKFTYYYELQVEDIKMKLCGDGISFNEEKKGLVIIQQILPGDKIFHKELKKFCVVKSNHLVWPSQPIQAKLLDSCLNLNEIKEINQYLYKSEELKFLDEQVEKQVLVTFSICDQFKNDLNISYPISCPVYMFSQYFIQNQQLFNHNSLTQYAYEQNTQTFPLIQILKHQLIQLNLQLIEYQSQSFNIFICSEQKLLISIDLPCQIMENQYEINTEHIFQGLQDQFGPGKLSVIGNSIQYNNNRIKTNTFDLYMIYHQNKCKAKLNVAFKLNENIITISLCEDTTVEDIQRIAVSLSVETDGHTIIVKDQLISNLEMKNQIRQYAINGTVDVLILKTAAYQGLKFMLLLQNDTNYILQQLFDSLSFISLPGKQNIKQLYNFAKYIIQKVENISETEAFCLFIYTTNYLHQSLNQQIRDTQFPQQQNKWLIYLQTILKALKKLPSQKKKLYRGIRSEVDYYKFKIGNILYFQNFLSTSDQQQIAIEFCAQNGTLFEIDCLNGKSVSNFSEFPSETEVLIAPYSLFSVQTITKLSNYTKIELKEIACPKSLKLILWIDSQQLSDDLQYYLYTEGYEILYVNANVPDLSENLSLWGSFYKNLSTTQMKIICNFQKDRNLELLKCIFNTHNYNKEVYIYMEEQLKYFKPDQYLGVVKKVENLQQIFQESKFILNFHKNEIITNILNILQLESGMLDSRYNKEWLPGKKIKNGITYQGRENWIGIGIRLSTMADKNYITLYKGVKAQEIKEILQKVNSGLNVNPGQLFQNQIKIINFEAIYALTDCNSAGQMQAPFQIGDLLFSFVLQVKVNEQNLVPVLPLKEVNITNCQIKKINKKEEVIIERLLIQYN